MSVKYMILGMLLENPSHGYRMKKCFTPFLSRSMGINDGLLYPALAKLEKEGLIKRRRIEQEKIPDKNMYSITSKGKKDFFEWLNSEIGEDTPVRYDFFLKYNFLVKCNFFKHLDRKEVIKKFKKQLELTEEKIPDFKNARRSMIEKNVDKYRIRILEFGLEYQNAKLRWLKNMIKELSVST